MLEGRRTPPQTRASMVGVASGAAGNVMTRSVDEISPCPLRMNVEAMRVISSAKGRYAVLLQGCAVQVQAAVVGSRDCRSTMK